MVEDELRLAIERAIQQRSLLQENETLRKQLDDKFSLDSIVGRDVRMQRVYELVSAVAPSKTTVLMSGESGTGKSLIAHAIHQQSERSRGPYVELACGSIPETLLESELFGHVKGSFTGAHTDKVGKFQAAHGGTLFLDEINSASPGMQLKLLRVLQERKFEQVGSNETQEVDVRVILASNEPLDRLVAEGRFRQDLYYRINVVQIDLPPLRERANDIPLLAEHFLDQFGREMGKELIGFSDETMAALMRYTYPGNVRELQNIIERAAVLSAKQTVGIDALPTHVVDGHTASHPLSIVQKADGEWEPMSLAEALREPERQILLRALEANNWNRSQTADQLEINRTTLYKKMKAFGIDGDGGKLAS
ncbi:MAG: sigma-54-dependent Fis family transcriptional regulator [Leptolyngbya sp. SIO3F4]|nr:sigma-54-dependent Fis family transcriptional regulator [Leptolyngbya sp. SIO3F4]